MVLKYDEVTIEGILSSDDFLNKYKKLYNDEKTNKLLDFLNNIETNKKYYKLGITKNKKYLKVESADTKNIKRFNCLINKLTGENYDSIIEEILLFLDTGILQYILENIINKSLMHHIYIHLYVRLINKVDTKHSINGLLNKEINKIYKKLMTEDIDDRTYDGLCKKNSNIDKISGLSILIAELEKENNIENNTDIIIDTLLKDINYDDLEYLSKILICIFYIIKITNSLKSKYKDKLNEIKISGKINSQIKFKIMDILEAVV
jgi:hypothetical protein